MRLPWQLRRPRRAIKQRLAAPGRFYGSPGTIHGSTELDVETKDGRVVSVWFRCQILPFTQRVHRVVSVMTSADDDEERARRRYDFTRSVVQSQAVQATSAPAVDPERAERKREARARLETILAAMARTDRA